MERPKWELEHPRINVYMESLEDFGRLQEEAAREGVTPNRYASLLIARRHAIVQARDRAKASDGYGAQCYGCGTLLSPAYIESQYELQRRLVGEASTDADGNEQSSPPGVAVGP